MNSPADKPALYLHSVTISNLMRLTDASMTFDDDRALFVVGGRNAQGKSSFLDAIAANFTKGKPSSLPIHEGAKKGGSTTVLVDDAGARVYTIHKAYRPSGCEITVVDANGEVIPDAYVLLSDLTAKGFGFDPIAFIEQGSSAEGRRKQAETLRRLLGLDFASLDAKRKALEVARTEINSDLKSAQGAVDMIPERRNVATEETPVTAVMAELEAAQRVNADNQAKRQQLATLSDRAGVIRQRITDLKRQLAEAEAEFDGVAADGRELRELVNGLVDVDEEPIRARLATLDTDNAIIRDQARRRHLVAEVARVQAQVDQMTADMRAIDETKRAALAAAQFPVPGLSFEGDEVSFNGKPLGVASSAEQVKIATAIGIAMLPQLKLILIRQGADLDHQSLRTIAEMAAASRVTVLLERPGTIGATFVLEDGTVADPATVAQLQQDELQAMSSLGAPTP